MTDRATAILNEALELEDSERAELAAVLLESLEPSPKGDIEQAWRDEVRHRLAKIESGEAEFIPWDQVRDRLLARVNGRQN